MFTYTNLSITSLPVESHISPYWYLVTSQAISHTAFRTKKHLLLWLDERGLRLAEDLPVQGILANIQVEGSYGRMLHMDIDEFNALEPVIETAALDNGEYTQAKITQDAQTGLRTVHILNVNVKSRPIMNYDLMMRTRG